MGVYFVSLNYGLHPILCQCGAVCGVIMRKAAMFHRAGASQFLTSEVFHFPLEVTKVMDGPSFIVKLQEEELR